MSVSLFTYMVKLRDGIIFRETFENDNFVQAQGWITLQGVPVNTSQQSKFGIKSLKLQGQSLPVIQKTVSTAGVQNEVAICWFYDDASNTTDAGPFFKVKFDDGKFVQVGVRNGVSTGFYVTNSASDFSEDSFAATIVARSTGWHKFEIVRRDDNLEIQVLIDGTLVRTHSFGFSPPLMTDLFLQADVIGGSGDSFGFFDDVKLLYDDKVTFKGIENRQVIIRDQDEINLGSIVSTGGNDEGSTSLFFSTALDFPLPARVLLSQVNKTTKLQASFRIEISHGDVYQFVEINFGRKIKAFGERLTANSVVNESLRGVTEILSFGSSNFVQFSVENLEGFAFQEKAVNLHEHLRKGGTFSLMVDSDLAALNHFAADYAAGTTDLGLAQNMDLFDKTAEFIQGRQYVILTNGGSDRQVVTIDQVLSSSTIRVSPPLLFPVKKTDFIREITFFPYCVLSDQTLGLNMTNPRKVRFDWNQTVREQVI